MNNKLKAILTTILAFIGGIFYRMGGSGNFARFWRELGQQIVVIAEFFVLGLVTLQWQTWVGTFLSAGMCWLESTYFKKKGTDAKWWNWTLVGVVFGLIPIPYCAFTNSHWLGFSIRGAICTMLVPLYQIYISSWLEYAFHKTIGKDVLDEVGRGFINIATLPLLLI